MRASASASVPSSYLRGRRRRRHSPYRTSTTTPGCLIHSATRRHATDGLRMRAHLLTAHPTSSCFISSQPHCCRRPARSLARFQALLKLNRGPCSLGAFGAPTRDHATSLRYERRGLCITFGHPRPLVFRVGVGGNDGRDAEGEDGRGRALAAHPEDDSGAAADATVAGDAVAAVAVPPPLAADAATSCRRETALRGRQLYLSVTGAAFWARQLPFSCLGS